jgi:flavorubredoxin
LKPANKSCLAFGSYGWAANAIKAIEEYFISMKWNIIGDPIKSQYKPSPELLDQCRAAGKLLGDKAIELAQNTAGEKICINP